MSIPKAMSIRMATTLTILITLSALHYPKMREIYIMGCISVHRVKESDSPSKEILGKYMSAVENNVVFEFVILKSDFIFIEEDKKCTFFSSPAEEDINMTDFEKIWDFQNLYKAHKAARLGKRDTKEVIDFELNLSENISYLSDAIKNKTYKMSGYYSFYVHDPKKRKIHALHYVDRVVQHCLCDEVLSYVLEKRLIFDNAACRKNKGTHFALKRVKTFLHEYYKQCGSNGYFLKCDIKKFFDSIDHVVLKSKLEKVINDKDVLWLLCMIIDSFETTKGKGLPMGNQTSQWFAVFYLDSFDRIIKEQFQIKFYSRYMDDCILIHSDKEVLSKCLKNLKKHLNDNLFLDFNSKTQIFPIKNGVDYLGWHIYLAVNGKIILKVRRQSKKKYKKKLKQIRYLYSLDLMEIKEIKQILASYRAHLSFGHTYKLRKTINKGFSLKKKHFE